MEIWKLIFHHHHMYQIFHAEGPRDSGRGGGDPEGAPQSVRPSSISKMFAKWNTLAAGGVQDCRALIIPEYRKVNNK